MNLERERHSLCSLATTLPAVLQITDYRHSSELECQMESRLDRLFLDFEWKRWIAENLVGGADPDELASILVEEGFSKELAQLEVESAVRHPYLQPARAVARRLGKRDWVLECRRRLEREYGAAEIERRSNLSATEFYRSYVALNRPVILTDVVSTWPAISKWTPEYLKAKCGDLSVEIQAQRNSNPDYEVQRDAHRAKCRFDSFVDKVYHGDDSNDFYMTAGNAGANVEVIQRLASDIPVPVGFADQANSLESTYLWLGPAGTLTPLHHDLTNNFMTQITGQKRLRMLSPESQPIVYNDRHCFSPVDPRDIDLKTYPLLKEARVYDLVLSPGELLFIPVGWWHHVESLSVSLTISFTNFIGANDFEKQYQSYGEL